MRGVQIGLLAVALISSGVEAQAASRHVVVNRVQIPDATLQTYEKRWQTRIRDGNYWYDRYSGAWGVEGGPTAGWIMAGLEIGGPLRADASSGNTGVFINGRELHLLDVQALMQIVQVQQGRWWVDSQGNFGAEGGPMLGNLVAIANQRGGKQWSHYSKDGHSFIGGDGNCTYFNSTDNVGTGNPTSYSYASPGC